MTMCRHTRVTGLTMITHLCTLPLKLMRNYYYYYYHYITIRRSAFRLALIYILFLSLILLHGSVFFTLKVTWISRETIFSLQLLIQAGKSSKCGLFFQTVYQLYFDYKDSEKFNLRDMKECPPSLIFETMPKA